MTLRVLIAFFSGIVAVISTVLIPVAHFGDENSVWTGRFIVIAFGASLLFLASLFWGI